jgi:hypothetical protein
MPLRLFGGQGDNKVRRCPACESKIAAEATFCPSCFMVIRPEGAADLRAHLRGGRLPTDIYLLRKLQLEDPNAGPVVRVPADTPAASPVSPASAAPPAKSADTAFSAKPLDLANGPAPAAAKANHPVPPDPAGASGDSRGKTDASPKVRAWTGVHSLVKFDAPLPPPAQRVEDIPALFKWMLEKDPMIPNNLELLEEIHTRTFPNGPAASLAYERHVLLLITDDLYLHPTKETLESHLGLLATAYRRAAGTYHGTAEKDQREASAALWQMSSVATRLRLEAWVYQNRHGVPPEIIRPRRPRGSKPSGSI